MIRHRFAFFASLLVASACGDNSATTSSTQGAGASGSSTSGAQSSSSGGVVDPNLDCTPAAGAVPELTLTMITDQVPEVIQAKSAPDDPDRLYVVEKSGTIVIIDKGSLVATPFLDIGGLVNDSGEEGLLGLAFHPGYASNGRFFVHYSAKGSGDNVVQEFKRSASDPLKADPTPVVVALQHPTAQGNHNGGAVEFGPDGFLYVSMGDGGNQGDPECDAQLDGPGDPAVVGVNLLGKISRIDVDSTPDGSGYPAAPGNPGGLKSYHRGFRNPWRMSFDVCTGDLYVGDVGQDTWEEVDQIPASAGAVNCGWPYREGTHDYDPSHPNCPPNPGGFVEPISDFQHASNGPCSVTGGYVYRSSAIPGLRGAYVYADYCTGEIFYKLGSDAPVLTTLSGGKQLLGAFGQDGRGNVYVTTLDGKIERIDQL
jgi:glucose/arabinose dehydrogenase